MANVRMALQMLQIACDNPKRQQHYFAIALKECNRQIDLINDLLDMQRLSAEKYLLQPEEIFLPHYLRDLVATAQPLAQGKKQNLQLRLEEGIPPLRQIPRLWAASCASCCTTLSSTPPLRDPSVCR
jgi:signal transduction histidine kinase